ncbi:2-dehydropantoate 2-reductase [Methylopila henanensis]|uniref:2-dehydropantoate 2-reductase n=1 Tax=Methylopila henanensis TaxID=873516 RepID=A0ABW4K9S6_9HYPH
MKICIYGAGAIGGYMAVMLKRSGVDVSLVARGPHLAAIRERGLKLLIDGRELTAEMPATRNAAELGPQDYVINGLKAHQAWESAEDMAPLLGDHTAVVTMQNGVPWWYFHGLEGPHADLRLQSVDPGDRQWNAIGPERVIGGTVYPATEIAEPGVVRHIYGDAFGLGEPNRRRTARLAKLADAIDASGLRARVYDDIRDDIWLKLWGNLCFNPISALTRATLDVIATDPATRALAKSMMLEAQTIGETFGATFKVDVERRINGAAKVGAHRTSMLQDVEAGKAIELDALLSAVQEMGRLAKVATPNIDLVLGLTKQMGRSLGLYPTFPESVADDAPLAKAANG